MKRRVFLALDLGASSGRAVAGWLTGDGAIHTEEIHRFSNSFLQADGHLCWDYTRIYREILAALRLCRRRGLDLACIGIDAWAQDYAWIDSKGRVLGLPRCYREPVIGRHADEIDALLGEARTFYRRCGQRKTRFSTLRQLYYDRTYQPQLVDRAAYFLFIPYLFVYLLTGQAAYDATLPAIGEMGDVRKGGISPETAACLGVAHLVPPQFRCGEIIGRTNRSVLEETGYDAVPVACIDAHDTSSAVLAAGGSAEFLFVSSGTWSMCGAAGRDLALNDRTYDARLCGSPMGDGRTALMTGTAGMFVIQQCMRRWQMDGHAPTYQDLTAYAMTHCTGAWFSFDNVPDTAADMPSAVGQAMERAGFPPPENPFQLYEAFATALARLTAADLRRAEQAAGRRFDRIYVVGGGAQAKAVNQRIAEYSGKQVCAGMTEAASAGNLLAQMVADGALRDFSQAHMVRQRTQELESQIEKG